MSDLLTKEVSRLNRQMHQIVGHGSTRTSLTSEVPTRIHSHELDSGGAPEWHDSFARWIDAEFSVTDRPARFRAPFIRQHPQRLKRAFRQLRRLDPKAHDAVYLMVVLGYSWEQTREKMNADNVLRGQAEYTETDFICLTVSGSSLLIASY